MPHDVIVIGGGIAGLTAANRAAQLGLSVQVLEAGKADKYFCNTRFTGGTFHLCRQNIMSGDEALRSYLTAEVGTVAAPEIIEALVAGAPRCIAWLREEGIRFIKASAAPYHSYVLAPPGRSRPGLDWEGRSGDVLLTKFENNLAKRGGTMLRDARATRLLTAEGRVTGVEAVVGGERQVLQARAVVIADGGFQGNAELVGGHVTPHPERLRQRGAGTGVGDGLRMATELGAAVSELSAFYGHLLSRDALTNDNLWPYPYVDAIVVAALVVGPDGRRFADEGQGGVYMANAVAKLPDPLSAVLVFDDAVWNGAGKQSLIPVNPHLPKEGGTFLSAPTLDLLAGQIGIDSGQLARTVTAYNEAVGSGRTEGLEPPRSGSTAKPIVKAPFHAIPLSAGITYTMGGVLTDGDARVLKSGGGVIDGLYAAGATVGGMEGGSHVGYLGGLARSVIFGMRAAEAIAA